MTYSSYANGSPNAEKSRRRLDFGGPPALGGFVPARSGSGFHEPVRRDFPRLAGTQGKRRSSLGWFPTGSVGLQIKRMAQNQSRNRS